MTAEQAKEMGFEGGEPGGGDWILLRDLYKDFLLVLGVLWKLKRSDFGLEIWVWEIEKKDEDEEEAFMAMVAENSMREREGLDERVKLREREQKKKDRVNGWTCRAEKAEPFVK